MKIIVTILLLASCLFVQAQEIALKGRIISEDLDVVPYAKITNQKNELLGVCDIEGRFEISIQNEVQELHILFVGMEPAKIELSGNCIFLEVVLMYSADYDYISDKKVYRDRIKRFKKLPKIHREAYKKGIFKTPKACYTQEFFT